MKKHIVFDFGRVLFRWRPDHLLAEQWPHRVSSAEAAAPFVAEFFQAYGGDWGAYDQGLIGQDEVAVRISARTGWPVAEVAQVVAAAAFELQPFPDAVALITELKSAGHRLFYLSNMPGPLADHLARSYPLAQWFETGVFSSRVRQIKPNTEIFHTALAQFGVAAADCIFLDDHPANVAAALALGWQALMFTTAAAVRPQLAELIGDQ